MFVAIVLLWFNVESFNFMSMFKYLDVSFPMLEGYVFGLERNEA